MAVLLFLILAAPFSAAATTIAVTLPPLAGIVKMLDATVEVTCLLPAAADPHHFQLQPRKIELLQQADLLVRASYDDGGWPLPPLHNNTLDLWPARDHGWLSPAAVREALPHLAKALIALNPTNSRSIEGRLAAAIRATETLEQAWRKALAPLHNSGVVMQHPAWKRLMDELNVPVLAVLESGHHGHEHGPHALDEALQTLADHPDALLLQDAAHINRALDWLAAKSGNNTRMATLNALGDCGSSWDQFMEANLNSLNGALQP
ncbi:ABC-type Zn uptake system ZnuABC, Zn-binding component ZnuA [Mariprofundus ferrinatatus]|uniref:ABC-type Zn uptake system ZnuABC, Zn-binding component ZnuA n=2 Tax=Mariprofundus ferrinatatus TaxID=1921087 RepID=A0A2K8L885_9PROT|nr:ABC-type Zn uptake system ZnuABC, Zn-binding component ZnuA [Mariprofundus ferrinatatus]